MDGITSFIKIVIAIISWQLTFVNTLPVIGNLFEKSSDKYTALEVIENQNHEYYLPIQSNVDLNENSSNSRKFLYFCPPQKRTQWQNNLIKKLGRGCLFLVEISDTRKQNINFCDFPVAPTLFLPNQRCGHNGKGVKLRLQLELYLPGSFWIGNPLDMRSYKTKWEKMENLNYATITFPIYTFCFEYKKHRTTFVTYNIVSTDMNEKQFPEEFHASLPSIDKGNDYDPFQQQHAQLCYKKENQNLQEEFTEESMTKLGEDHLVEQMMVSWEDINEDLERGSTQNYINVAAQWNSIREDWNKLSTFIKKKSLEMRQKPPEKRQKLDTKTNGYNNQDYSEIEASSIANKDIYMGFQVTCGTYGKFDHIRLGKVVSEDSDISQNQLDRWNRLQEEKFYKELGMSEALLKQLLGSNETKPNDHISPETHSSRPPKNPALILTASLYWWKLITYKEKGIVLIMPNIPKSMPDLIEKYEPLCEDISESYGWKEVKTFNKLIICCKPTQELLGKLISSNANTWEWNIPTTVLSLEHDTSRDNKNQI